MTLSRLCSFTFAPSQRVFWRFPQSDKNPSSFPILTAVLLWRFVIPGCAAGADPEIHGAAKCEEKWIPGSRFARPGMTAKDNLAGA
jgi:hypothetical protein